MRMNMIITSFAPYSLSLRGSLNAYDPWSVTSHCKGFYKGSSAGFILGSLRVKVN
uniref:Uncharacterized protein n=1 Tax=Brassica oleracea var. oleracea TaxID=109376 RepID=A0A0D2ZV03_BRAOL